jgi:CDP-2,3-bis-(O-geranylgeranyl)-sn-glycerol synthase
MDVGLIYSVILYPIIFIFPAYAANALPVIFGGGAPLDFGGMLAGRRIFGDHKTIRGTLSGIIGGILVGYAESLMFGAALFPVFVALVIGAIFGDILGSFIKRRLGLKPGHGVPVMDWYGFFIFALVFALPFVSSFPNVYGLIFLVVLTGILHPLTNIIAHRLKLKKVPW